MAKNFWQSILGNQSEDQEQSNKWECPRCNQVNKIIEKNCKNPECKYPQANIVGYDSTEKAKPNRDNTLLAALTVLNITSGYTTIKGALQIFPGFLGYFSGSIIQILLFLLVSGSTLRHAPKLKWLAVASFSTLSVYTSFFAYYEFLAGAEQTKSAKRRAEDARSSLIAEIYTPIDRKVTELESAIDIKAQRIENEIAGNRVSGLPGCGDICKQLKNEKEELEEKRDQLRPTKNKLQKIFQSEQLAGNTPDQIFKADIKAIGKVPNNCLPQDPEFDCLPEKYENLNPQTQEYKKLRDLYIDQDSTYILLRPFHKIRKREAPAIAAGLLSIMVDGLIIALGTGVEIRPEKKKSKQSKLEPLTLSITGKGSTFIEELLHEIDLKTLTINYTNSQTNEPHKTDNKTPYMLLLHKINTNLDWVKNSTKDNDGLTQWDITSESSSLALRNWLIKERERLIQKEMKDSSNKSVQSSEHRQETFFIPIACNCDSK